MRRLTLLASLLALVAVACKIETNMGAIINADGSGTIVAEIGMDEEALSFFGDLVEEPFADTDLEDLPNASVRQEQRGDMNFWVLEAETTDIAAQARALVSAEESLVSSFEVTITADLVTVSARATAEETFGDDEFFDPTLFEDAITANVFVVMPGEILSHNADSRQGNRLTWTVPVLGGTLDIEATSDPRGAPSGDGDGIPTWLIAVIAGAAVAAVLYFLARRRQTGAAGAGSGPGGEPPPMTE